MKTRITFVSAVAVGVMSFMASCSNEAVESAADAVMLEAEVNGIANTRAAVEGEVLPEGSNYGLYVYQDYKIVADNVKMAPNSTATGYLITGDNKVKVAAYYPYSEKAVVNEDMVEIYPGSTDYLHTVSSEIYTKSNPKASIQLHHALARVKFNVTAASDATGSFKVSFSGIEKVYTKGSMRLGIVGSEVYGNTKAVDIVKFDKPLNDEIKAGTTISTEVFLLPQSLKEMEPYFFFSVDGESKGISSDIVNATTSGQWESGKVYTYNITISEGAKLSVSAATIEEWGEVEEKGEVDLIKKFNANGHEYVDLGLTSGTLWATCNVDATSPEESGGYYAWGETETKSTYSWSTYKWCNGTRNSLTKYCVSSSYGTEDNKIELDLEDDVAHVKWGGDWRMPTNVSFYELLQECDVTREELNGVSGYLFTSKSNGNKIFLSIGYYWASTLYKGLSYYGCGLLLNKTYFHTYRFSRENGQSVRPVLRK